MSVKIWIRWVVCVLFLIGILAYRLCAGAEAEEFSECICEVLSGNAGQTAE